MASEMNQSQPLSRALEGWQRFLESALVTTHKMIAARSADGVDDEALIVRNAARLLRLAFDWDVEATDPNNPRLASWEVLALTGCPPGPNINAPYSLCRLDSQSTYVLEGSTDGLFDVVVQLRSNFPPKTYEILGDLGFADIKPVEGRWKVTMGPKPVGDSASIQFPDHSSDLHLFLRIYWIDWTMSRRRHVSIRRIAGPDFERTQVTAQGLVTQLDAAARYLEMRARFQYNWFVNFLVTTNQPRNVAGSSEHFCYKGERFALAQDEAFLVSFNVSKARFWSVQLYDGLNCDCMEFLRAITLRNLLHTHVDVGDRVRMVIAHRDPDVQNWLDADGSRQASWMYRAIRSGDNPEVTAVKCGMAQIKEHLYPNTPVYSAKQCKAEMSMRQHKLAHHFF